VTLIDVLLCPCCKKGRLHAIATLPGLKPFMRDECLAPEHERGAK